MNTQIRITYLVVAMCTLHLAYIARNIYYEISELESFDRCTAQVTYPYSHQMQTVVKVSNALSDLPNLRNEASRLMVKGNIMSCMEGEK